MKLLVYSYQHQNFVSHINVSFHSVFFTAFILFQVLS